MHAVKTRSRSTLCLLKATMRAWLPFAAALLCLLAVGLVSPIVGFVAIVCALALIGDGAAVLYSRGGNVSEYRQ